METNILLEYQKMFNYYIIGINLLIHVLMNLSRSFTKDRITQSCDKENNCRCSCDLQPHYHSINLSNHKSITKK